MQETVPSVPEIESTCSSKEPGAKSQTLMHGEKIEKQI